MNPMLLGAIVGTALAGLNFLGSTLISSRVVLRAKVTSVLVNLGSFVARLTVLSLLFYALSGVKEVHFQTTLVAFAIVFTLCLAFKTVRFYRQVKSFTPET